MAERAWQLKPVARVPLLCGHDKFLPNLWTWHGQIHYSKFDGAKLTDDH